MINENETKVRKFLSACSRSYLTSIYHIHQWKLTLSPLSLLSFFRCPDKAFSGGNSYLCKKKTFSWAVFSQESRWSELRLERDGKLGEKRFRGEVRRGKGWSSEEGGSRPEVRAGFTNGISITLQRMNFQEGSSIRAHCISFKRVNLCSGKLCGQGCAFLSPLFLLWVFFSLFSFF